MTTPTDEALIAELSEKLAKATPGEWYVHDENSCWYIQTKDTLNYPFDIAAMSNSEMEENAALIVTMKRHLPAFLSRLRTDQSTKASEDAQPYKDALHDILMLKSQDEIGCVPPPMADQWAKAWASAWELFEP